MLNKATEFTDRKKGRGGEEEYFSISGNLLVEVGKHNNGNDSDPHASYSFSFRFQEAKTYRNTRPTLVLWKRQSDADHSQTPQTALLETTLMSHRWSLIKPLATTMILIGVIYISWQLPQFAG